jgi:putative sterol carrier protein
MSGEKVRAIFERRRLQPFVPQFAGVTGSYRFDVAGVASFFVAVNRGMLTISEENRAADCVIVCNSEEFLRIAEGRQNLLTAWMQGLVDVRGDLSLAQKLHGVLPALAPAETTPAPGFTP